MKRSKGWWKIFAKRYQDCRQELIDHRAHRAHVYRNYLLKADTIRSAYERLDNECQNTLITEDDKMELESIILRLKAMRGVISKSNKITEMLDKFDIQYVQNISLCGIEIHYLGYVFIKRPKLTWEMCLFAITFSDKPLRQYALKLMGINNIKLAKSSDRLRVFLSQIGRGSYVGYPMISNTSEGLDEFWKQYEKEHLIQAQAPKIETDFQPEYYLPLIKEPEGYLVDQDTFALVEKLTF